MGSITFGHRSPGAVGRGRALLRGCVDCHWHSYRRFFSETPVGTAHYLGSVVGQLTYELIFLKIGPLVLVGIVFLLGYSVVFLLAAAIAGRVRSYFTQSTF